MFYDFSASQIRRGSRILYDCLLLMYQEYRSAGD
jgi:hypothetical protein